jgi:hypothetical protein
MKTEDIKKLFYKDSICVVCGAPCRVLNGGYNTCSKRVCFEAEFARKGKEMDEAIKQNNINKKTKANV